MKEEYSIGIFLPFGKAECFISTLLLGADWDNGVDWETSHDLDMENTQITLHWKFLKHYFPYDLLNIISKVLLQNTVQNSDLTKIWMQF